MIKYALQDFISQFTEDVNKIKFRKEAEGKKPKQYK